MHPFEPEGNDPRSRPRRALVDRLRRFDDDSWADWLVPLATAAVWSVAVVASAPSGIVTQRSFVFVGGPLVLLSGLHARMTNYLHAKSRLQLLPTPIDPAQHFRAARPRHVRGLATTVALGTTALAVAILAAPTGTVAQRWGLVADWAWLVTLAFGVEPIVAACAAWLGRRFPPDSTAHTLQRNLGGGWTLPEAVIHLYAPAFGVGLTAALAMPGQLLVDQVVDGHPPTSGLVGFACAGAVWAGLLFVAASPIYARGLFGSVPWLAEATRTLAGPPVPGPVPRWVTRLPDPVVRLLVLQFLRKTPVPMLRLGLMLVAAGWLVTASSAPDVPHLTVFAGTVGLWLVPATNVADADQIRQRLTKALPLAPSGPLGIPTKAWVLLLIWPIAGTLAIAIRWGLLG